MTIKAQSPPVCVGQYLSNGVKLMQITGIDSGYISVVNCADPIPSSDGDLPLVVEKIAVRELGYRWFRIYPKKFL